MDVEKSNSFKRAQKKAEQLLSKDKRPEIEKILSKASDKSEKKSGGWFEDLGVILDMIKAVLRGDYVIDRSILITLVAMVVYFVMPFDVIPDFLLGFGFIDDVAILGWGVNRIRRHLDAFKEWQAQGTTSETDQPNK